MARSGQITWVVHFNTLNPMQVLPRAIYAAAEVQDSPHYYNDCRLRSRESHCIFKYSLRGEGCFRDARGEHRVPAGSGFLVRINDPEASYYYPADGREPWAYVYLAFEGGSAHAQVAELVARYGAVFRLAPRSPSLRRLLAFGEQAQRQVELAPQEAAGVVMDLLLELAGNGELARRDDPGNALVRLAQEVVSARLEEGINVSQLAQILHVSREHLTRVFTQTLHRPPHDYIQHQRIRQAGLLLSGNGLTVKQIAARLGYRTPSHFGHSFKVVTGMTPAAFREQGHPPIF